jgi:hypothetical protein
MGRVPAESARGDALDLGAQADELRSRFLGGVSRLKAQAQRGARKVKDAAQDLRASPALQHALAARERGNLEAAFWLLNEAFMRTPDPQTALHYWDVALLLGRVDIASAAGVQLIESHVAAGEPELAAQIWLELVREAPDVLVSPTAIATMLPALKARLREADESGAEDARVVRGWVRRAVRHAVDPRNAGLHPGVALRIFGEGRDVNPEAACRAAEAALESPHLHEAKRERLTAWLREQAASRSKRRRAPAAPETVAAANGDRPRIIDAALTAVDDDGLALRGVPDGRMAWSDIQAVCVAEILELDEQAVTVVDLVRNWTRRHQETLDIVRLRLPDLDLASLVSQEHAVESDFAAFMGDVLERSSAVPLPDPESALGTRISCFANPELYERVALRLDRDRPRP